MAVNKEMKGFNLYLSMSKGLTEQLTDICLLRKSNERLTVLVVTISTERPNSITKREVCSRQRLKTIQRVHSF
jgi:hypothetical protein